MASSIYSLPPPEEVGGGSSPLEKNSSHLSTADPPPGVGLQSTSATSYITEQQSGRGTVQLLEIGSNHFSNSPPSPLHRPTPPIHRPRFASVRRRMASGRLATRRITLTALCRTAATVAVRSLADRCRPMWPMYCICKFGRQNCSFCHTGIFSWEFYNLVFFCISNSYG